MRIEKASFLGGADFQPGDQTYKYVFETARFLAQTGITVLNGGGPGGSELQPRELMQAAAEPWESPTTPSTNTPPTKAGIPSTISMKRW